MSVGFTNPIGGMNVGIINKANNQQLRANGRPVLGGGIPGFVAQFTYDTDNTDSYVQTRFTLRNAWNNSYKREFKQANLQRIATPFRAVTNSGDLLAREWIYYIGCGGPCQSFQSRPGMFGLKQRFGASQNVCDNSGIPAATCNTKYVYDSSDYSTYLKQKAIGKNYNNVANGGNLFSAAQSASRAIRRY